MEARQHICGVTFMDTGLKSNTKQSLGILENNVHMAADLRNLFS